MYNSSWLSNAHVIPLRAMNNIKVFVPELLADNWETFYVCFEILTDDEAGREPGQLSRQVA
jgi:hypothetical protein